MSETATSYYSVMVLSELEDVAGRDNVKTRHSDKLAHAVDYYWVPRCWVDRGREPILPDDVVYPESTAQVSKILRIANQHRIPVTVWGGGSGSQGGALPIHGGIVLDTKKMNRIVEIDETLAHGHGRDRHHHAAPGVGADERKLSTMHVPASIGCATLGGFLAHRGTGVLSTKYGKIEDMIMSLEAVLPDGTIVNTLAVPRHASGPDLNQLFLGLGRHVRRDHQGHAQDPSAARVPPVPRLRVSRPAHGAGGGPADHDPPAAAVRDPAVRRGRDPAPDPPRAGHRQGRRLPGVRLRRRRDLVDLEMRKAMAICRASRTRTWAPSWAKTGGSTATTSSSPTTCSTCRRPSARSTRWPRSPTSRTCIGR